MTTQFRYQSGHRTGAVLRQGRDTHGVELRYIPGGVTPEQPGGVNIKGYDRASGELLWEHVGIPIAPFTETPNSGVRQAAKLNGRLPVHYWLQSERTDIGVTLWTSIHNSSLFPPRVPRPSNFWAEQPNSAFTTWERRIKYIDMETGDSFLSTIPTEYVSLPNTTVQLPFATALAGDPNLVGVPSISLGSFGVPQFLGEVTGGLLAATGRPSAAWQCLNPHEPDTAVQRYRMAGRFFIAAAYYEATIPAWDVHPEALVTWNHNSGGDDISTALQAVPQIVSATYTGPGMLNGYGELVVEWADETLQFTKIVLKDHDPPRDPPSFDSGGLEIWDGDTMEVRSHRSLPLTGLDRRRRTSHAKVMGNGNVAILHKYDQISPNILRTYSGTDLKQQLAEHVFSSLSSTVVFFIHSAQNNLILNRRTGSTTGGGGQESDNLGWHIMDFDLTLIAEWWRFLTGSLDIFHLSDKFYPSEVAGSATDPALAVVTQYAIFNGFRVPGTLGGVQYDGGTKVDINTVANATSRPLTVRKFEPFTSVLQATDVESMNAPFEVTDVDYSFTGGISGPFPQFESRRVAVQKGANNVDTVASGVDGNPFGAVLGFAHYVRWWQPGIFSGWRAINDGTVQWRIGFEPQTVDTWTQETPSGFTDWMEFDADQDDLEAALFDVFGEHFQGGSTYLSNVGADHGWFQGAPGSPEGSTLGLNHDLMLWQDSITLLVFCPWSGSGVTGQTSAEHFELANAAGMTGHFNSGNSANPAQSWALFQNDQHVYLKVHVRDSNWPNAPQFKIMDKPLGAIRWSDGQKQWERYFGQSLSTGQNVGCSLIMNYAGSTIVGFGETVESELQLETDE